MTFGEAREGISANHTLTYDGYKCMRSAFIDGNASMMIWLVKTFKAMNEVIYKEGCTVSFFDEKNRELVIDKTNFRDFVLKHFDDFVYKEIYSERELYND